MNSLINLLPVINLDSNMKYCNEAFIRKNEQPHRTKNKTVHIKLEAKAGENQGAIKKHFEE